MHAVAEGSTRARSYPVHSLCPNLVARQGIRCLKVLLECLKVLTLVWLILAGHIMQFV